MADGTVSDDKAIRTSAWAARHAVDLRGRDHLHSREEHDHEIGLNDVVIGDLDIDRGVVDDAFASQFDSRVELALEPPGDGLVIRGRGRVDGVVSIDDLMPPAIVGKAARPLVSKLCAIPVLGGWGRGRQRSVGRSLGATSERRAEPAHEGGKMHPAGLKPASFGGSSSKPSASCLGLLGRPPPAYQSAVRAAKKYTPLGSNQQPSVP